MYGKIQLKSSKRVIPIILFVIIAISIFSLTSLSYATNSTSNDNITHVKANITSQTSSISKTTTTTGSKSSTLATALDSPLTFSTGGNASWQVDTITTHDGVDSAKSGKISNKSQSWISTTVTGPGNLKWWWKISSEPGYDYLNLYLDGELIGGVTGEVDWSQKVLHFKSGTHTIKWAYQKDEYEAIGRDTAWLDGVQWTSGLLPDLNNTTYAILVGVAEYKNINSLSCPDDDVFDMYDICSRIWNMPTSNIFISLNSNATKANINSLFTSVAAKMTSNDKLLFFFSGHGSSDIDLNPIDEADDLDEYIKAYDADIDSGNISDDELQTWLGSFPTSDIICIFDSCYSGGMAENRVVKSSKAVYTDLNKYQVLMASAEDQLSYEYSELKNGVFTYYLCEAFEHHNDSSIDLNQNGIVSAEEAFKYAKDKSYNYAKEQSPQMHDPNFYQEFELLYDNQAPIIVKTNPKTNAIQISPNTTITITFNEFIQPGITYNNITLISPGGSQIPIRVSLTGNYLTINPLSGILAEGLHTVQIPISSIMDMDGNLFSNNYITKFTIDATPPKITVNPIGGLYRTDQTLQLTINEAGRIYYTIDGTTPDKNSTIYTKPINISSYTLLKFFAIDSAGNQSQIFIKSYRIDKNRPVVKINIPSGRYCINLKIKLTMSEIGTIFYSTNGKIPSTSSYKYTEPILVTKPLVLYYFARDKAGNRSILYVQKYIIDMISPKITSINPAKGQINVPANQAIKITFNESIKPGPFFKNITLRNSAGSLVTTNLSINSNVLTITHPNLYKATKYIIYIPQLAISDLAGNYIPKYASSFVVDAIKPTLLINSTRRTTSTYKVVYLAMNEPGTIYYTLDGSKPTSVSYKYTKPIIVNRNNILKYFAEDLASNRSSPYISTYYVNQKSSW